MEEEVRIVIDTTWWISMILSKQSTGLPEVLLNSKYRICFSKELMEEVFHTLSYPTKQKRINDTNLAIYGSFINSSVLFIDVKTTVKICRDPNDDFLLALSKDAGAKFLITDDPDLLVLKKFETTTIISFIDFIKKIQSK